MMEIKEHDNGKNKLKKCELCGNKCVGVIRMGVDVGFHFGDALKEQVIFKAHPRGIAVASIYLCDRCKDLITKNDFSCSRIINRLKEECKEEWVKDIMLDELRDKSKDDIYMMGTNTMDLNDLDRI